MPTTLRSVRGAIGIAFQLAVLAAIAFAFTLRLPEVSGLSMEPRIASGEFVLINTMAYTLGEPAAGDIIAFRHDGATEQTFIKRIIGVPGDRIEIRAGTVVRNGVPLVEPYVRFRDRRSIASLVVPKDRYFVLGDNRADSEDSRDFGTIARSAIVGLALVGLWPPAYLAGDAVR